MSLVHTHKGHLTIGVRDYLDANSKVLTKVLVDFDLEVTVTVATHKTPGTRPVIVTALLADVEDVFELKTELLSDFFFTATSIVTPSLGKVELIFAFITTELPTTANTLL